MILDIVIVILLILGVFVGYKKGLVKIILKFVGFILSLVLAYFFCTSLAEYIYNDTGLGNKISIEIQDEINGYIDEKKDQTEIDEYYKKLDNILSKNEKQGIEAKSEESIIKVSNKISMYIIKGLSFILIIVLVNICVLILTFIFGGIFNLPVLKTFNKTGGAIVSVVLTVLKIWIALAIISVLSPTGVLDSVLKMIQSSVIANWLYNNNLLVAIIVKNI